MRYAIALLAVALSGCQSYGGMSADQISAVSKDAAAVCIKLVGNQGVASVVVIHGNVPTPPNVTVNAENCNVSVTKAP